MPVPSPSRGRPARDPSRPAVPGGRRASWLLVAALLLPLACGGLSRQRFASLELARSRGSPEAVERVRAYEPMLPGIWSWSALLAGSQDPERALELVERGLEFHPRDPELLLARVDLLSRLGREDEVRDALDAALGRIPPAGVEAWLQAAWVRAHLAAGELEAAEERALVLGGVRGVPPLMVSDAWARVALAHEALGHREEADAAMDRSLDRGAAARQALADEVGLRPERQAAARSLRRRAAERHPGDADLALSLAVDRMVAGELAEAAAAIEALPAPVPARLASEVFAVHARVLLLQGRTEEGLAVLRDLLRRSPGDGFALDVLMEAWLQRGELEDEEVAGHLRRALRELPFGRTRQNVELALQEIEARAERADVEGPPAPAGR